MSISEHRQRINTDVYSELWYRPTVPLCRTEQNRTEQPVAGTQTIVFGHKVFKTVFSTRGAAKSSMSSTKAYRGGEMRFHSILMKVLDGCKWSISRPVRFNSSKEYLVPTEQEAG
jgi:hypothetical protein